VSAESVASFTIALAGQPNVGKSTVFNRLTGLNQHVGNWPGKTVEQKTGEVEYEGTSVHLVDLPGTYSLTANSE
jgi:ferrous iron transport protein B